MEDRYLYKAKRVDNKEWIQGVPFEVEGKTVILISDNENMLRVHYLEENMWEADIYAVEVDPSTICQCTGLKDKNSKLIWENDIIKTFDAGEEWCLSKIIFADTSLGCGWKTTDIKSLSKYNNNLFKEVSFGSFDSKSVEIVGNIFDNKELLESEE